jgi:hypothetical protein
MMLVGSWSSRASVTARSLFVSDIESSKQLSSTSTATSEAKHDLSRQNLGTKRAVPPVHANSRAPFPQGVLLRSRDAQDEVHSRSCLTRSAHAPFSFPRWLVSSNVPLCHPSLIRRGCARLTPMVRRPARSDIGGYLLLEAVAATSML